MAAVDAFLAMSEVIDQLPWWCAMESHHMAFLVECCGKSKCRGCLARRNHDQEMALAFASTRCIVQIFQSPKLFHSRTENTKAFQLWQPNCRKPPVMKCTSCSKCFPMKFALYSNQIYFPKFATCGNQSLPPNRSKRPWHLF